MHDVRVGHTRQFRGLVVGLEGGEDVRRVVDEVDHIGLILARVAPVQA